MMSSRHSMSLKKQCLGKTVGQIRGEYAASSLNINVFVAVSISVPALAWVTTSRRSLANPLSNRYASANDPELAGSFTRC
jgi:hypothetical protein